MNSTALTYEIRPPRVDDSEAIIRMHAQSWLDSYPNEEEGISKEHIAKIVYEKMLSPTGMTRRQGYVQAYVDNPDAGTFYRLATVGPKVIGFVVGTKDTQNQSLDALYVDKQVYGTGVAQALFDAFLAWADPALPISVDVVRYNERAIGFYKKQGFKKIPGSDYTHHSGMPSIKMKRETV